MKIVKQNRLISLFLVFAMVIMNITNVKAFAATSDVSTVTKDSEENIKIYRKTSLAPWEEQRKFNIPFHSNEPLGIEVLKGTEIEVTITGDGIYGSASLNLHDVDNLRGVKTVKVGEPTIVTVPRKGELFLDVAGVKYKSNTSTEDFSFNVSIKLVSSDYKVTPTYDVRENKISDNTITDALEFKNTILSSNNKEDGALLISDNVRIYIPKSKYINNDIDPDDVLRTHERTISEFNRMAGLDVNAELDINKPRESFILVSARNEQAGYMSAGGQMLDTLPQNIYEYLKNTSQDIWGMYHEYGHLYEQSWGFIEYWNNIFANNLRRLDLDNPTWAWWYGANPDKYEDTDVSTSYEKVLTKNEVGTIHPMYFFLSFIDNIDKNFMQNIETYTRENNISYGGWDYIAYFAAKQYGLNIIPYIQAAGEVITNKQVIKDVIENSNKTFIYTSNRSCFDAIKKISMPVTVDVVYSGSNQVINGMSNPNSEIYIDINGKEVTTRTDENGKFSYAIEGSVSKEDVIKIASKEDGKEKSIYKTIGITDSENNIIFRGYKDQTILTVSLDEATKIFKAESTGIVANPYVYSSEYIKIGHYSKDGELKGTYTSGSLVNADELATRLTGVKYIDGDYLKLNHGEPSRLIITGYVKNSPYLFTSSLSRVNLNNSYFYINNGQLEYSTEKLSLQHNKDDLAILIEKIEKLDKNNYVKTSWLELESALNKAKEIVVSESATKDEVDTVYNELSNKYTNLKGISVIKFLGYNDLVSLELKFDTENNKFIAKSNSTVLHPFVGGEYIRITHYDKKGNVKGTYSVSANQTADLVAAKLNEVSFIEGDYLKLYHREQTGRLRVQGYLVNSPGNLSNGVGSLDLNNSYFYLTGENLEYSNVQLDLSANKDDLKLKIEEAKKITSEGYTNSSYEALQNVIEKAESLVNGSNVDQSEIDNAIASINDAISELKKVNKISFLGYNDLTFLSLEFDIDSNKFIAKSNGQSSHVYQGGSEYIRITHYDKKGNVKGTYSVRGTENANAVAEKLNSSSFAIGDYIKLYHREQTGRLRIAGYIENYTGDLSKGVGNLDLNTSYFYLTGENLEYSNVQLDLSADKEGLKAKITEAKQIKADGYTKTSFENLENVIKEAEELVNTANVYEEEITEEIEKLNNAIKELKQINTINFLGLNDLTFLSLGFDMETNKFVAVSNGKTAHQYFGGSVYATITHYDKKGTIKGTYSVRGNETADAVVAKLNTVRFSNGDYLKLYHKEQTGRLRIAGYIENCTIDLSRGVGSLDLNTSYFYLTGENLEYSNVQLDLSANKDVLRNKIVEAKAIKADGYTASTFEALQAAIVKAENLVNTTNIFEEEVNTEIENLTNAIAGLREVNKISFLGLNDLTFLSLEFDMENNKFIAKSNGQTSHIYQGGAEYIRITHYDKKGNVKGTYSVRGTENANAVAEKLNAASFVQGDYLKLYHKEQAWRLRITGYVENRPESLKNGSLTTDLNTSYFYINGENLEYSNVQLDLSANKDALNAKIEEAKAIKVDGYTASTFEALQAAIVKAENLVNTTNVFEEEVNAEIENLTNAIAGLREVNKINFLGYNDLTFLSLEFDMDSNKFIAKSNGQTSHIYQGGAEYIRITHYDKKGNVKGTYSVRGTENANAVAEKLNAVSFVQGDYLKLYHKEQAWRLRITGYVENRPTSLTNGSLTTDLNTSYFYINGENLEYSNVQLDLSANKDDLKLKIAEAEAISSEGYTKGSFETLKNAITAANDVVAATNVYESEVNEALEALENAIVGLKKVNTINFLGYNNLTFLSLSFDMENNKFKAVSNGQMVHAYQGGNVYTTITHYAKDGSVKGTYSVRANQTANEMAAKLNEASFEQGDYLKLYHLEQSGRLRITGYIENYTADLSKGVGSLDLNTSYFYINGENLEYSKAN